MNRHIPPKRSRINISLVGVGGRGGWKAAGLKFGRQARGGWIGAQRLKSGRRPGQALVEFALVAPMLVLMLCGVVYCGGLVASQQNLAIAARAAARAMAIESTRQGLKNAVGQGGVANKGVGSKALEAALPGRGATLAGVSWGAIGAKGSGHAGSWSKTGTVMLGGDLGSTGCGVGVAFYGATAKRDLSRDLSPIGRLAARMAPGGGLSNMLTPSLSASSVMPAELPIRGNASTVPGVLDLNPWIAKVVKRPFRRGALD